MGKARAVPVHGAAEMAGDAIAWARQGEMEKIIDPHIASGIENLKGRFMAWIEMCEKRQSRLTLPCVVYGVDDFIFWIVFWCLWVQSDRTRGAIQRLEWEHWRWLLIHHPVSNQKAERNHDSAFGLIIQYTGLLGKSSLDANKPGQAAAKEPKGTRDRDGGGDARRRYLGQDRGSQSRVAG
jgi:hypothetical protein